jgi:hypothetical protein
MKVRKTTFEEDLKVNEEYTGKGNSVNVSTSSPHYHK